MDPKDPKNGNPPADPNKGNPPVDPKKGTPTDEDIKNLQRIISEKDRDLKDALKKLEDSKKGDGDKVISELNEKINKLTEQLNTLNQTTRRADLAKAYPDILPDLLIGKSDEEIAGIVEKQREINKKLYGDSETFIKPEFEKEEDIDKKIKDIQADKSIRGELAAIKILDLKRLKSKLFKK